MWQKSDDRWQKSEDRRPITEVAGFIPDLPMQLVLMTRSSLKPDAPPAEHLKPETVNSETREPLSGHKQP
jgi:hypothetical protein